MFVKNVKGMEAYVFETLLISLYDLRYAKRSNVQISKTFENGTFKLNDNFIIVEKIKGNQHCGDVFPLSEVASYLFTTPTIK